MDIIEQALAITESTALQIKVDLMTELLDLRDQLRQGLIDLGPTRNDPAMTLEWLEFVDALEASLQQRCDRIDRTIDWAYRNGTGPHPDSNQP
jgi:hypothetical protein